MSSSTKPLSANNSTATVIARKPMAKVTLKMKLCDTTNMTRDVGERCSERSQRSTLREVRSRERAREREREREREVEREVEREARGQEGTLASTYGTWEGWAW